MLSFRRVNYESWLAVNAAVKDSAKRAACMSILAFDAEISGINRSARSAASASMRYDFWRIGLQERSDFNGKYRRVKYRLSFRTSYFGFTSIST